ncbi:MAG: LLM class F420-dependent oxidoreductase [Microthrixaceae bacterium]|nr:LLM class F420-dependent oxidoreductase [Microthrixaceae bacterium]MCO5317762.1 LLM class F420-dependent oxidoreductase [Microthrixaceae bacterium]
MDDLQLGMIWGYWGQLPPANLLEATKLAEDLGFDSVWTAEAWGSDVFSPLAYLAGHTSRIRLGTSVVQLSARTPTATAMHAITLDHLSNGRLVLGLGASGPQVVEGWYGQPYRKPLARTREYVEIIRRVLAREEPLEFDGEFYQHPYHGPGSMGLGKPLKSITHPLRREIPIFLGAEGPKNVTMTAEIADGWIPLYYSPFRQEVYAEQLAGARDGFEIIAMANINITDDVEAGLAPVKAMLAFYIGGMGARGKNFHTDLMARMGFEEEAHRIQELFLAGRKDEAVGVVPSEFADEISLVGPRERIAERLEVWRESPVTTVTMYPSGPDQMRAAAELVLG